MNELISNFRLSNKVFALVLKDEKLISKDERLLEVTSPISISILLNLRGYNSYVTTDLDDKFYEYEYVQIIQLSLLLLKIVIVCLKKSLKKLME